MSLPPGWYRDPVEPTVQRWWDGEGWLGEALPVDATPPPGPPPVRERRVPQVPAVPGPTGAAEPPAPLPPRLRPGVRPPGAGVPPGWPYRRPPDQAPPKPHGYPLATIGSRMMARLVDIGIVLALNVVANGWFVYLLWTEIAPFVREAWRRSVAGESMANLPGAGDAGNLQLIILIVAAALWFAYEVPAIANTGQTPGKRLLRIKVVRLETSQPLGFGRSFRRWNTMGLPTLLWWCFGIGFLLQAVDALFMFMDRPLQQALHDKSAYTVVISVAAGVQKEAPDEPTDPS